MRSLFIILFFLLNLMACSQAVEEIAVNSPDTNGDVGRFTSVMLEDNRPIIAYYDNQNRDLKFLHCGDVSCNKSNNISTLDNEGMVGSYVTMIRGGDNNPVIAYYDSMSGHLKMLVCSDPTCGNYKTNTLTELSVVGKRFTIAIGSEGNPVITYYEIETEALKLLRCKNPYCNSIEQGDISTLDSKSGVGMSLSMVLDSNHFPVIAYHASNEGLKFLRCQSMDCKEVDENISRILDSGQVGWSINLALNKKGLPVIGYTDFDKQQQLWIITCQDEGCINKKQKVTLANKAGSLSMVLNTKELPVISYYDVEEKTLKLLLCDSVSCENNKGNQVITLDDGDNVGLYSSLVLDALGNPVISYYDFSNGDLKLARCRSEMCNE